ncbi:DUF1566 domain-containing protein [bacterium]|nr:DUF1566 domain-containing protein [bacterium]
MQIRRSIFISLLIVLFVSGLFAGKIVEMLGGTDSLSSPGSTESYTVNDIYNRFNAGTAGSQSIFTEPAVAQGTPTTYTLNEIMARAPVQDDTHGAAPFEVLAGRTFWGQSSGAWGPQTGTVTTESNVTGAEGALSMTIPDGLYTDSKTAAARDTDLVADNIKAGVKIFGVTGNIYVSGRFTDNGDGTVTDYQTGLMWPKNIYHIDGKFYPGEAKIYCETFTFAGYSDWRVPTIIELCRLIDPAQRDPAFHPEHLFIWETEEYRPIISCSFHYDRQGWFRSLGGPDYPNEEYVCSYLEISWGIIVDPKTIDWNDFVGIMKGYLWPVRTAW